MPSEEQGNQPPPAAAAGEQTDVTGESEWRAQFALFDADGDGHLTATELREVMRSLGMKPEEGACESMINEVDADGNGTVEVSGSVANCTA